MWIRYPIAILLAYGVFLLLLRLWLWLHGRDMDVDLDDIDLDLSAGESVPSEVSHFSGVRDIGDRHVGESVTSSVNSSSSSSWSGINFDLDLEEGWFLIIALIVLIGALIASLYIIYIAPLLLA